ncbi:MAG: NERD domain-containing protein [Oceanococcus sp.]
MARMIPNGAGVAIAQDVHPGEAQTLKRLINELTDDYTVFHSVHWARSLERSTKFGEIDFVVVSKQGHALVIEQKNGRIEETEKGLVKRYRNKNKNVHDQIGWSIEVIRKKFPARHYGHGLIVDYLIYCPDHSVLKVSSPMLDMSRIVDKRNDGELIQRIENLLTHKERDTSTIPANVIEFFTQSYNLVPDVGTAIAAGERAYTRLSSGLQNVIQNLSFEPFRLRIQGVAGCGKTQVALNFLQHADESSSTLYVCFNRPLRDQMAQLVREEKQGLMISTFHGLCVDALEQAGQPVNFSKQKGNPNFWSEVVESVIAIDVPDSMRFKRLVVDEGQDFQQEWWDVLQLFLTKNYELIWFEDKYQNLRGTRSIEIPATVTYQANISYRTPPTIADFIASTHGIEFKSAINIPGMGVGVSTYNEPREQWKLLNARITSLRRDGFKNEDIVILTCKGLDKSELYQLNRIAGVDIRKFTLKYDVEHKPIYTDGQILFDSVHRFKGGQAPCVILIDVDPPDWRVESGRPVLFCGMTRATVRLEMLVKENNPHVQVYIDTA